MLAPRREPFEQLAVQADGVSAGAKRQPVEVDRSCVVGVQRRRVILRQERLSSPGVMTARTRGVAEVENVIEIARLPEVVFDYWVDLAREPEWNPKARRVQKLTEGPIGLGTRFEAEYLKGDTMTIEYVGFDRPVAWETIGRSARLDVKGEGRISATKQGARLVMRMELDPKGALRLLLPIIGRFMHRQQERNLVAIKQALEGFDAGAGRRGA